MQEKKMQKRQVQADRTQTDSVQTGRGRRLRELEEGQVSRVREATLSEPLDGRLKALGLTDGAECSVLACGSRGRMIVKVRGTRLALGPWITGNIRVAENKSRTQNSTQKNIRSRAQNHTQNRVQNCTQDNTQDMLPESCKRIRDDVGEKASAEGTARVQKGTLTVALAGNPNCGKTTLFNALTGANRKVANWPGVTVERVEGEAMVQGRKCRFLDLPGIYSLSSYSLEEQVARSALIQESIDVIVDVADAVHLERSLFLTLQLLRLHKPVILVLNMMDVAKARGIIPDRQALKTALGGIPVVPLSARSGDGMEALCRLLADGTEAARMGQPVGKAFTELPDKPEEDYAYIERILASCLRAKEEKPVLTDRIDRLLTHRVAGLLSFFLILAVLFFLTFTVGDFLKGGLETILASAILAVRHFLTEVQAAPWLVSLIADGILKGVGAVLAFLPNLFILYLLLAVLEDSGYMARVAYVMDPFMEYLGLSGKAFLPMVLGFGCTVPAVLACRTLENQGDRKRCIRMVPFMSCSARLPVYVLFSEMFFPSHPVAAACSLYVLGMAAGAGVAFLNRAVLNRTKHAENVPLLIELPEYRMPGARTVFLYVREKTGDYLQKAGSTIFLASVALWLLLNNNSSGLVTDPSVSFGAALGRLLVPVLRPAGLGLWQLAVALLSGLTAKEVVVSSLAVLYGAKDAGAPANSNTLTAMLAAQGFGQVNAYAFMVFCLLYTPCVAAMAAIRREVGRRQALGMALFQLLFAWLAAVGIYQLGSLWVAW